MLRIKKKLHIISTVNILELHRSLVKLEIQVKNTPFFTVLFLFNVSSVTVTGSEEEWLNSTDC